VAQGSGTLGISNGDVVEIQGAKLTSTELKANALTNPLGSPVTTDLSTLGTVAVTDQSVVLTATMSASVFYLLRADNEAIVYSFS
jgi:hypothetical protein